MKGGKFGPPFSCEENPRPVRRTSCGRKAGQAADRGQDTKRGPGIITPGPLCWLFCFDIPLPVDFCLNRLKFCLQGVPFCLKFGVFKLFGQKSVKITHCTSSWNTLPSSMKQPFRTLTFATPSRSYSSVIRREPLPSCVNTCTVFSSGFTIQYSRTPARW